MTLGLSYIAPVGFYSTVTHVAHVFCGFVTLGVKADTTVFLAHSSC